MVKEEDAHHVASLSESLGQLVVLSARTDRTARMIV